MAVSSSCACAARDLTSSLVRDHILPRAFRMLRGLAILLFILGGAIGIIVALVAGLFVMVSFAPAERVAAPLPMAGAVAYAERWTGFNGTDLKLVVETPAGSAEHQLWTDWGYAGRINLYRTPDDWLVALGGGEVARMFELKASTRPRAVSSREKPSSDSETWTYLGAIDRDHPGAWRFFSPEEKSECFATFGFGGSPHRAERQALHCR